MKEKRVFQCTKCGYKTAKWMGRCPQCQSWDSFAETLETKDGGRSLPKDKPLKYQKLKEVAISDRSRFVTGLSEFNRVTGGGIVRDSVTIITSPPGGGKSTLALIISAEAASQGIPVLYATGEESAGQIKSRADRIIGDIPESLWIISDTSLDNVIDAVNKIDPEIIIIDSIQTFSLSEFYPARAGNPVQTMECASRLQAIAKNAENPKAVIIIGQMNKSDELAGLRALEHLVDTVLYIEGGSDNELRSIFAAKNRFGSTGEMGFFNMTERGLESIDNPSEYFITKREKGEEVSGSAITVIREGLRPIIVEIESLVSEAFMPYPSRIGDSLRRDQLNTLVSIMEQRGGIRLSDKNIVIKAMGGIRLREPSVNLAVIMSIISSVYDIPIGSDTAFIADVGLTGELKKVPSAEARIKELARMGFKRVYIAEDALKGGIPEINILRFRTLGQVIEDVFGRN